MEKIYTLLEYNKSLHVIIYWYNAPEEGRIRAQYYRLILEQKERFLRFIESDIITKETVKQRVHMATENIFENFKYENDRGASAKNEHRFEDDEFEFLFLDIDKIVMK